MSATMPAMRRSTEAMWPPIAVRCGSKPERWRSWTRPVRTTSARSWPCLVRISSSIRSSVAMPPAQVSRLRSLRNSCSTTSISGWRSWNSCTASQCRVIAVAVEQAGSGQREGAGVDRTQQRAVPVEPAQPGEQAAAQMLGRLVARDDEHGRAELDLGDAAVGHQLGAAAGRDGPAVGGEQPGREQPPAGILVRHPQRLDRQNQRVDREFGQQQEADLLGGAVARSCRAGSRARRVTVKLDRRRGQ